MDKYKETVINNSVVEYLEKAIEEAENKKKSYEEQLKNSKLGFFDKRNLEKAYRDEKAKLVTLSELKKQFNKFTFIDEESNYFMISDELKSSIEKFGRNLSEEEFSKLKHSMSDIVNSKNRNISNDIDKSTNELLTIASKYNVTNRRSIPVYVNGTRKVEWDVNFKDWINELSQTKKENKVFLELKSDDIIRVENELFDSLEEMIGQNILESNKMTQELISNFDEIKNAYEIIQKNQTAIVEADMLISEIKRYKDADYSSVISVIENIRLGRLKESDRVNKKLKNIDFDYLEKQVNLFNENKRKNEHLDSLLKHYEVLAHDLAHMKATNNLEEIKRIEAKMREIEGNDELSKNDLREAATKGETDFERKVENKEIELEIVKEEIKQENAARVSIEKKMENYLMEMARDRVGLYSSSKMTPDEYDNLIKEAIQEIKMESYMTPEDRMILRYKKIGKLPPDATRANLKEQDLLDAKSFYNDSREMFEYKKLRKELEYYQSQEEIKKESNVPTIYAEYMQAKVIGTTDLSFDDYVKLRNGISLENEQMVNIEEGRGR